jgi:hypothetical protein
MKLMDFHNFSHRTWPSATAHSAWQVIPLAGRFEVVYEDARGAWTTRILDARELKLETGILDWLLARADAQRRAAHPRGVRRAA